MLHGHDALFRAHTQVHGAAHAGHFLAGDDPVGEAAFPVHLQGAQNAGIHMAATDQGKVCGGIRIGAVRCNRSWRAASIRDVIGSVILVLLVRPSAGTYDPQLSVDRDLYIWGKELGDHGGKADAQVHNVAIFQLFCRSGGDDLFRSHSFTAPFTM